MNHLGGILFIEFVPVNCPSLLSSMFPFKVYRRLACDLGEIEGAADPFLELLIALITQKGNILTAGDGCHS